MNAELLQVVTTTSDRPDASRLAAAVLEKRLAACVQIHGPVESHYWWNGRIEQASEWKVVIKTHTHRYAELEKLLLEIHPYDEPEILATPVEQVSAGYLQWLKNEMRIE